MRWVLLALQAKPSLRLQDLLQPQEGRLGLLVTFLALLELAKLFLLRLEQASPYAEIWLEEVADG